MRKLIQSRIIQMFFVLLILSFLSFIIIRLAPGDPVKSMLNVDEVTVTEAEIESVRSELGFDDPIYVQYWEWLKSAVQLDLGESYMTKEPVFGEIMERLPTTLTLIAGGMAVVILIAIPLGIYSAIHESKWIDRIGNVFALLGASIPNFWLGLLLIYLFSVKLNVLPFLGNSGAASLILPSLTLGLSMAAIYARLLRSSMLSTLKAPYIQALRMKGIQERSVIYKYALRESILPVITMFGMSIGNLLAGTIVIEILFSWPGLGKMVVDAILNRDYPLIQGYILCAGFFVMLINLVVDVLHYQLDPRMRLKEE